MSASTPQALKRHTALSSGTIAVVPVDAVLLEELAANAWPAATVQNVDGWRLRHTPGVSRRRSNSVLPRSDPYAVGNLPVPAVLDIATEFYARRNLPVRVQVSPAEHHHRLDDWLAGSGLGAEGTTEVLVATLAGVRSLSGDRANVEVGDRDDNWLRAWDAVEGRSDVEAVGREVLDRIGPRTAYARMRDSNHTVAVGMAVVERGWAGLFCIGTLPQHRRRGHGLAVLGALAEWASSYGARDLYLQVEVGNAAAQALYRAVGFERSHRYHYRSGPAYTSTAGVPIPPR